MTGGRFCRIKIKQPVTYVCYYIFLLGKKNDIFEDSAGGAPKREVGKISVSFTPRVFPTPERESVRPQEEEVKF